MFFSSLLDVFKLFSGLNMLGWSFGLKKQGLEKNGAKMALSSQDRSISFGIGRSLLLKNVWTKGRTIKSTEIG